MHIKDNLVRFYELCLLVLSIKYKIFAMKKIIVMAAIFMGCSVCANAQKTQEKLTVKPVDLKTQKKGTTIKQATEFKSTTSNTAIAPLFLPIPRPDVDTTFLPVVKRED
jgi:hypothetical protein